MTHSGGPKKRKPAVLVVLCTLVLAVAYVLDWVTDRIGGVLTANEIRRHLPEVVQKLGPDTTVQIAVTVGIAGLLLVALRVLAHQRIAEVAGQHAPKTLLGLGAIAVILAIAMVVLSQSVMSVRPPTTPILRAEKPQPTTAGVHKKHHQAPPAKKHGGAKVADRSTPGKSTPAAPRITSTPVAKTASRPCTCKGSGGGVVVRKSFVPSEGTSEPEEDEATESESPSSDESEADEGSEGSESSFSESSFSSSASGTASASASASSSFSVGS